MRITSAELTRITPQDLLPRLRTALTDPADPIALLLPTSGSTGPAKQVLLPSASLLAAARASHARLGGPGHWLAALPLQHIGGLQVLVRAISAETEVLVLPPSGFSASAFSQAAQQLLQLPAPHYTSLVPTQLARILAAGPAAAETLAQFTAVLIGGAPAGSALLAQARAGGITAIDSYGMTETCGGVVYDGIALPGVHVALCPQGRVEIGGSIIAAGYLGQHGPTLGDEPGFQLRDGQRWFRSNDLGTLTADRLALLGRADDLLLSGGVNVNPLAVEEVLLAIPGIRQCLVVGVPDPEWGQRIEALIVGEPPALAQLRAMVRTQLGVAAAPRALHRVTELPLRGPGKPDRHAATALAQRCSARAENSASPATRSEHQPDTMQA